MIAAVTHLVSGSRHIVLNAGGDIPDHTTSIVVGVSKTGVGGVMTVLRRGGCNAVHVDDVRRLRGRDAFRRFPAPRLIVVSHDPVALVEELGGAGRDRTIGVRRAKDRIRSIVDVALTSPHPVLLLSHGLAIGPLADLAAVVGPFCGIDPDIGEAPAAGGSGATPDVAAPPVATTGFVALRADDRRAGVDEARTIIIGGPPRSGTSMVAAVLHAAGLPLGESLVPSTFESALQNALFKPSSDEPWTSVAKGSWKAAIANPRYFRMAWRGFDVRGIKSLVADRRRDDGPVWGIKRPGIGHFIRLGGLRLLDSPRVILSLRDPVAAAARIVRAHDVDAKVALRIARWFLLDSLESARACTAPTLLVSHDAARTDLHRLFGRLLSFSGLEVDAARYDEIAASVERAGAEYIKDFAQPFLGELLEVVDHDLYGWVRKHEPVFVEIFADDRPITSGWANEIIDEGRLFTMSLPPAEVTNSTSIRAVVSAYGAELRKSGLTLAELRRT